MLEESDLSATTHSARELLLAIEHAVGERRRSPQLPELLRVMLVKMSEIVDTVWAAAWVFQEDEDAWVIAASLGLAPEATRVRFRPGAALPCRVGERGEPLLINDLDKHEFHRSTEEHYRMRSALYAPMKLGGRTVGVVAIYSDARDHYVQHDLELLTNMAAHLAVTVAFAIMEDRARQIAVLEERDHHARDLHDGVHQVLSSLKIYTLEARTAVAQGDTAGALAMLDECQRSIDEASEELRFAIAALRNHVARLDDVYVVGERMRRRLLAAGVVPHLKFDEMALDAGKSDALAWICREGTTNVLKHSSARNVNLLLVREREEVILRIEDDGVGTVSKKETAPASLGIGLEVMAERAAGAGGRLEITPNLRRGFRLECRLPV